MIKKIVLAIPLCIFMTSLRADSVCSVIDIPGLSFIGADVVANPTDPNDAIFCIQVSNVTLDLSGFNISQDLSNTVTGFNGIVVSPGLSNITIRNGTIQGLTGMGIIIGDGCTNITIENINVINCDTSGIFFDGNLTSIIQDGLISNCFIYSCTGAQGNPAYGLRLVYCDNIAIENSTFDRNDAASVNNGYGISAEWCTTCNFSNCEMNANGGENIGIGINLYNSDWSIIENCRAMNNISRASGSSQAVGFLIDTSNHTSITNCVSKHNNNVLAESYGFKATNGSDNVFELCQSNQNIGGTVAAGFLLNDNESNSAIINCQSRVNNGGASGDGYGILLDTAQNCDILFNDVINNTGSTGIGLSDTVVNTTNLIAGTISFNNTTTGYQVSRTVGAFPMVTASLGDFSTTTTSKYLNIDFVQ